MRIRRLKGRGRPRGKYHSNVDLRLLEYLARISIKYEVDSDKLFEKFVEAWRNQESVNKDLTIKCRRKNHNHAVFLITKGRNVVAQFHIPEHLLKGGNPIKEFIGQEEAFRKSGEETYSQIMYLRVGMKKIRMKGKVLEISEPRQVYTKFGSYARVANVLIGDETGTIMLSLWNKQIDAISVGDQILVENAQVVRFRGELQLRIGRQGKMNII